MQKYNIKEKKFTKIIKNIYMNFALKKCLHSEGHPERFTELHGEEKREEGVRGDPNEMRWNQKRRGKAHQ